MENVYLHAGWWFSYQITQLNFALDYVKYDTKNSGMKIFIETRFKAWNTFWK